MVLLETGMLGEFYLKKKTTVFYLRYTCQYNQT